MTNLEYLLTALQNDIDDGASFEAAVYYHIACPYFDISMDMPCIGKDKGPSRSLCVECKTRWLKAEVSK